MSTAAMLAALFAWWPVAADPVLRCHKQDELGVDWSRALNSALAGDLPWEPLREVLKDFVHSEYSESPGEIGRFVSLLVRADRKRHDDLVIEMVDSVMGSEERGIRLCGFYGQRAKARGSFARPDGEGGWREEWHEGQFYALERCLNYGLDMSPARFKETTGWELGMARPSPPREDVLKRFRDGLKIVSDTMRFAALNEAIDAVSGSQGRDERMVEDLATELAAHYERTDDPVALRVFERNRPGFVGGHAHAWGAFLDRIDGERVARTSLLFMDLR